MYDDMSDDTPISEHNLRLNPVSPTLKEDIDSDDMIPQSLTQNRFPEYPEYDDSPERQLDDEDPSDHTDTQDSDIDEDSEAAVRHLQLMVRLMCAFHQCI
jgi:hypothetical protein